MIKRLSILGILLTLHAAPARAADVTGSWRVRVSTANGQITGFASFKQNGNSVTGWVGPSPNDPISITGSFEGNKLTIETHPRPGRTVAFHECVLTLMHNKMAGAIDTDKGTIEFLRSVPTASPH